MNDTGHPFGFYRCLVHDDGHVAMLANSAALKPRIEAMAALLAELGLPGWRLQWLPPTQGAAAYAYGLGCKNCVIRVSCGCDVVEDVLAGLCPHGTAKAIEAAAKRCGYVEATGGPLQWAG